MYTENDYRILKNIGDKNDNKKGFTKLNATTINEIVDKTELSYNKVRGTLMRFLNDGMVDYGVQKGRTKTYHLTIKGLTVLSSINTDIKEELEDE